MTEVSVKLQSKTQQTPVTLTITESSVRVETESGSVDLCALDFRRLVDAYNKDLLFEFLHRVEKEMVGPSKNPKADLKRVMRHSVIDTDAPDTD